MVKILTLVCFTRLYFSSCTIRLLIQEIHNLINKDFHLKYEYRFFSSIVSLIGTDKITSKDYENAKWLVANYDFFLDIKFLMIPEEKLIVLCSFARA